MIENLLLAGALIFAPILTTMEDATTPIATYNVTISTCSHGKVTTDFDSTKDYTLEENKLVTVSIVSNGDYFTISQATTPYVLANLYVKFNTSDVVTTLIRNDSDTTYTYTFLVGEAGDYLITADFEPKAINDLIAGNWSELLTPKNLVFFGILLIIIVFVMVRMLGDRKSINSMLKKLGDSLGIKLDASLISNVQSLTEKTILPALKEMKEMEEKTSKEAALNKEATQSIVRALLYYTDGTQDAKDHIIDILGKIGVSSDDETKKIVNTVMEKLKAEQELAKAQQTATEQKLAALKENVSTTTTTTNGNTIDVSERPL